MTAIPTEPIPCANPPRVNGRPTKRTHRPTFISGFCEAGNHAACHGFTTHACGCSVPCRCTAEHPADRPHPFQESAVLPDPFTVPPADSAQIGQATVTEDGHGVQVNVDWHQHATKDRPWVDGTGAPPAPLEVMVRAFAMAAGDLHQNDDTYDAYDETAHLAMLGILRASMRRAGELDALLVAHLHEHGTWGKRVVDGIGEVRTYRRPKSVKWDERGTAKAVVDYHMEQLGGEQPDPYAVVAWLLEAAAIGYYRTTALQAMGIDPEDYRHSEKGTRAVDVPVPD